MTARAKTLLPALSFTVSTVLLAACGDGLTYGMAPGPIFVEEPPPTGGNDAGGNTTPDAGPPPTPTDGGCVTVTTPVTPEDDLAAFRTAGIQALFTQACKTCHGSRNPAGTGLTWGATADDEAAWFEACSTLLELDRNAGKPVEETTLYGAFSGVFQQQPLQHQTNAAGQSAVADWVAARQPVTETICDEGPGPGPDPGVDAGPGPGPDPGGCVLPTKAESEARFLELDVTSTFLNCQVCHAGANHSPTGEGDFWGSAQASPTPTDWHDALWVLTDGERAGVTVETSSLYDNLNGAGGKHVTYAAARDASEPWLDYVLNGAGVAGCP